MEKVFIFGRRLYNDSGWILYYGLLWFNAVFLFEKYKNFDDSFESGPWKWSVRQVSDSYWWKEHQVYWGAAGASAKNGKEGPKVRSEGVGVANGWEQCWLGWIMLGWLSFQGVMISFGLECLLSLLKILMAGGSTGRNEMWVIVMSHADFSSGRLSFWDSMIVSWFGRLSLEMLTIDSNGWNEC